jgi:CDP-diglyceride synthetase
VGVIITGTNQAEGTRLEHETIMAPMKNTPLAATTTTTTTTTEMNEAITASTTSSTTTATTPIKSTTNRSLWSDLPRRLATVAIGFPIVCHLLAYPPTARLFFVGVHVLMSWEWSTLMIHGITTTTSATSTTITAATATTPINNNIVQYLLLKHPLSFCCISLGLAWIPSDTLFHLALCGTAGILMIMAVVVVGEQGTTTTTNATTTQQQQLQFQKQVSMTLLGFFILTVPMRAWYFVVAGSSSRSQGGGDNFCSTIALLLTVWNCDTGALIGGRVVAAAMMMIPKKTKNRHRILSVPQWITIISPAKSMEGFIGGIVGGCLTTVYLIPWLFASTLSLTSTSSNHNFVSQWWMTLLSVRGEETEGEEMTTLMNNSSFVALWMTTTTLEKLGFGMIWSILAILGDLMESAMKRHVGIKDSGKLLPGMGGILDRFDSTLLAVILYQHLLLVHQQQEQQ